MTTEISPRLHRKERWTTQVQAPAIKVRLRCSFAFKFGNAAIARSLYWVIKEQQLAPLPPRQSTVKRGPHFPSAQLRTKACPSRRSKRECDTGPRRLGCKGAPRNMSTETNELGASGAKQKRSSYSENGNEANSKEDVLLQHVEISVSESEKRANGSLNLREYYTVYLIETKAIDPDYEERLSKLETVWRRYTEFEQLRDYLEATYPYVVLPPLPEKRVMFGWQKLSTDTFDPDFVDRRRAGLENFLLRVAAHPVLSWDEHFIEFLRHEDGWRESLRANGYLQVAESKLKSLNVSVRLKNGDPHFDNLKTYAGAFHTNVYNLLKARSRVAEKQYTVYKLHRNYGRVFSEWSAVEREMGDALQKTGHYLDSLASSIDASLEDEELLVDQLKEYLFFASSLQNVCRHQETLRYAVEVAEENVAAKNVERVKAQQGKLGLMSRLFGAVDTDEVRELKVNVLDQQIQEGAIAVNKANEELKTFCDKASKDIERFQNQKAFDLKDTLASYVLLQLKTAKKGLQTWTQIRDCLQNIP